MYFTCKGYWRDSRGRRHDFEIESDRAERSFIKELVEARYPASGGVTINNVVGHIQQKDLPFGGVGPSGMGRYQSFDGFKNFSNPRAFYKDVGFKFDKLFDGIRPPYTKSIENLLKSLLK